jgi:dethiobiotin synthetase/adenosylmethionine--8-amino-7-oxononanoate aminotransferase
MEVALKMALRAYTARHGQHLDSAQIKQLGVIGLKGSYHGDTIGAMDACEEGVYTCEWHSSKGYWFDPPSISIRNGRVVISLPPAIAADCDSNAGEINPISLSDAYDVPKRLKTPLADVYRNYIHRVLDNLHQKGGPPIAALVIEPLVLGAGGMIFVDPLFQRVLVEAVRGQPSESPQTVWSGMPVIFDEVFVGLYRIGMQSPAALLGVNPDIAVYAKILTGGLVPLAVTLASDSIFQAFLSQTKTDALLHGHSYTAHALGCEVANETLKILKDLSTNGAWEEAQRMWMRDADGVVAGAWSFWDPTFVDDLSRLDCVAEVMTLGTVLAFKVKDKQGGRSFIRTSY